MYLKNENLVVNQLIKMMPKFFVTGGVMEM